VQQIELAAQYLLPLNKKSIAFAGKPAALPPSKKSIAYLHENS